ncbi:MAG: putative tricarboxylic transport membrane protein [Gammaproteobacteria bacterium]
MLEENFRRALIISGGDYSIFVTHPISVGLLIMAVLSLLSPLIMNKLANTGSD